MKKIAIVILIALLGLGAVWALKDQPSTPSNITDEAPNSLDESPDEPARPEQTISYSDSGFTPTSLSVSAGTVVTIKNNSSRPLDFASDDHPTHRDNTELNIGTIEPGQSRNATFSVKGSWGFHNHLLDSHSGRVTVE